MVRLPPVAVRLVVRLFRVVNRLAVISLLLGFAAVRLRQRLLKAALLLRKVVNRLLFMVGMGIVGDGARLNLVPPLPPVVVRPLAWVYPLLLVFRPLVRLPLRAQLRPVVVRLRHMVRVLVVMVVDGRVFKRVMKQLKRRLCPHP